MNIFKKKQLTRVIESIGRAANIEPYEVNSLIKEYTNYDNYEAAIKDLTYKIYRVFNDDIDVRNYSLDMIRGIAPTFFKPKHCAACKDAILIPVIALLPKETAFLIILSICPFINISCGCLSSVTSKHL